MPQFPKIALTGATGFIGGYVLAYLESLGFTPTLLVRSRSGLSSQFLKHSIVEVDINNPSENIYERSGCPDILIHLSWGGLPHFLSCHHFEEELPSQYQFLKTMISGGLQTLFVSGTCFEYGMVSGPLNETMETKPANPYGFAKDSLRKQLEFLQKVSVFNLVWGRLFYLYGQGQFLKSLKPQLEAAVARGDSVFNMSGGEQLRDYLEVSQLAKWIVNLALKQENIGIINICSGNPISVRRFVEGWIKENNWQIELKLGHYPYPDYEPMAFWGDNSKLKKYD